MGLDRRGIRLFIAVGVCSALISASCYASKRFRRLTSQPENLARLLANAQAASRAKLKTGGYVLSGSCRFAGVDESFEMDFDGPNRCREVSRGPLEVQFGFDGTTSWVENWSHIPHETSFVDGDSGILFFLVVSGLWAVTDSGLSVRQAGPRSGDPAVLIRLNHGSLNATLTMDRTTSLPKSMSFGGPIDQEKWTFAQYRLLAGRIIPTAITHRDGPRVSEFRIQSGKPASMDPSIFSKPVPDAKYTEYDPKVSPIVPIRRAFGYTLVRPKLNGQDCGWFLLDTGSDCLCVDPGVAERLKAKHIATDTIGGAVAELKVSIYRMRRFEIGPVAIIEPTLASVDMTSFSKALEVQVVGVCGYDFLARSIIDLSPGLKTMGVYPPGSNAAPDVAHWAPFRYFGQSPAIGCRFEGDRDGVFEIDTASPSNVDFTSPAVIRLKLMETRKTADDETSGVGGDAKSKTGSIAYFEMGGHKFENETVGLQSAKSGAFSNPYLDGIVGTGFLSRFRLIFDYRRNRIGFMFVGTP